ncbi:MAG: Sjogren's syndrome/scleroderma autoantigen 1 family protein [Candidatus Helarchaeota archaeon]
MEEEGHIKKMAQMLRKGYTMVSDVCPACQSPLFLDKSKQLFCANCEKRVIKTKGDEGITALMQESGLLELKKVLNQKLNYINALISKEKNLDELNSLLRVLLALLDSIERIKRIGTPNIEGNK